MNKPSLVLALLTLAGCHSPAPISSTPASKPCEGLDCHKPVPTPQPPNSLKDWRADYSHYSALDEGAISFKTAWGDVDFPGEPLVLSGTNAGDPGGMFMFVRQRFTVAPSSQFKVSFSIAATVDFAKDCATPVVIKGGAGDIEPKPVMAPDYMMRTSITQDPVVAHERFTAGGEVKASCDASQPSLVTVAPKFAHAVPAKSAADGSLWVYVGFETASRETIRIALKDLHVEITPVVAAETAVDGLDLPFSFATSTQGWQAGFADYPQGQEAFYELTSELAALPAELNQNGNGMYISGVNRSDDLLMYLWTQIGPEQGLKPATTYRVDYTVDFASNVPQHCQGVGGSEGESVTLKVGAAAKAPQAVADAQGLLRLNWNIGSQTHGGEDASVAGHIANELSCEDLAQGERPYRSVQRQHAHTHAVTTDQEGRLWLFVGTDSGFESKTSLYFTGIKVKITPVTAP